MVSNQVLVNTLDKIYQISNIDFSVYSMDGLCVTREGAVQSESVKEVLQTLNPAADVQSVDGKLYFAVHDDSPSMMVLVCNEAENAEMMGKMAVMQLEAMTSGQTERIDKDNFIKNLLLDNLLLVDIYHRAKKLGIDTKKKRIAYLIETKAKDDINAQETLRSMYVSDEEDFVTAIDEQNIVLVKNVPDNFTEADLMQTANTLADMMNTEAMSEVRVAYGNVADEIRRVSNSYKEAKLAMSIGKIFDSEKTVVSYSSLGIGRLVYQLPVPMCRMFIEEIFKNQSPEDFDEETLSTINQFFANSLNVSETSRQLYIHRNTLVYRLDKLQKNTGLDLRVFDDAITFKIALMVVKYMRYMDNQDK